MKYKYFFWVWIFFATTLNAQTSQPQIEILTPQSGTHLLRGYSVHIKWTHSPYFDSHPQNITIFCDGSAISPPLSINQDSFSWTVGVKENKTMFPPGEYALAIEGGDFVSTNKPVIRITEHKNYFQFAFLDPLLSGRICASYTLKIIRGLGFNFVYISEQNTLMEGLIKKSSMIYDILHGYEFLVQSGDLSNWRKARQTGYMMIGLSFLKKAHFVNGATFFTWGVGGELPFLKNFHFHVRAVFRYKLSGSKSYSGISMEISPWIGLNF
jgi:hypothetical protein